MPGYSGDANPYHCNDCISSKDSMGCSCNWSHLPKADEDGILHGEIPEGIEGKDWRWVTHEGNHYYPKMTKEDGIWQDLDELGRPLPCAEYSFDEEGFDVETWWSNFYFNLWWKVRQLKQSVSRWWNKHICTEVPPNINI